MHKGKIRILQVTHDLNIGGLQRVVVDICSNLDPDGFSAGVLCLRESGPLEKELAEQGIPVFTIKKRSSRPDYLCFLKMIPIFRRFQPDIIHTHNTQPFIDGTLAGQLAGIPVIHTDHARAFPDKKRYMVAERILSMFVHKVVAVSGHTKRNLVHYEKINPDKIDVIHNGIDGQKYQGEINRNQKRRDLGVEDRYPLVGLGVRLTTQKGITHLIQSVPFLKKEFPNIGVLIAGDGYLMDDLKQEAAGLGISDCVRFTGPRTDMNEILQVLDVYVLPSLWEGLPLGILEAMAAGKPIVATDVGGTSEVIRNGENGILVPSENSSALSDALVGLLKDADMMSRLAANAEKSFRNHFSVQVMTEKYMNLYLSTTRKS